MSDIAVALQADLADLRADNKRLRREVTTLKAQIRTLEQRLARVTAERDQLKAQLAAAKGTSPRNEPAKRPPTPKPVDEPLVVQHARQIEQAYLQSSKGEMNTRVHLADLRRRLPHLSRAEFDRAAFRMMTDADAHLMPLDDPHERSPQDNDAVMRVAGDPRHIMYLSRTRPPPAPAPPPPPPPPPATRSRRRKTAPRDAQFSALQARMIGAYESTPLQNRRQFADELVAYAVAQRGPDFQLPKSKRSFPKLLEAYRNLLSDPEVEALWEEFAETKQQDRT